MSGNLVDLGERRVVEDTVHEEVESAAEGDHGLADVDELRGIRSDAVNTE